MNTLLYSILQIITPTIVAVVIALITYAGVKTYPTFLVWLKLKIGVARYNHLKLVGTDVWALVEDYKRLNPEFALSIANVQSMFGCEIKKVLPSLTESQIIQVRQTIAGVTNKYRTVTPAPVPVLQDIEKVAQDVIPASIIAPIIKYMTEDGIELQPVVAPIVEATIVSPITDSTTPIIPVA
jgi:hypothetical protein